jgi:hypothetical protein
MARLEPIGKLGDGEIEIRPRLISAGDQDECPAAPIFIMSKVFKEIEKQSPPTIDEPNVVYPDNRVWKQWKDKISITSDNLLMADPPEPEIELYNLTVMQRHACDLIVNGLEKI